MRLSTVGRVREAGFALLATFDHPHFTLVLADLSELTVARLDRCFDEPIPNPGRPPEGQPDGTRKEDPPCRMSTTSQSTSWT